MADTPKRSQVHLPKVAVAATSDEVRAVADKVDKVNASLVDQLRNFEAADADSISGVPASSVIASARAMYYQTFEDDVVEDWILVSGSSSAVSYPTNGKAGGRAFRTTNKAITLEDNTHIPLDPSRLYRMRTRYCDVSGTHRGAMVGVRCYDGDKNLLGTLSYTALNDASNDNTNWTTATGYFKNTSGTSDVGSPATNPASPAVLHKDTRYIRPFLALSDGGDDQVAELDYISLEILTETPETNELLTEVDGRAASDIKDTVKAGSGVATDKVDSYSVQTGTLGGGGDGGRNHMRAGSMTANEIKAGTITASEIKADSITANEMSVGQLDAIVGKIGVLYAGIIQNKASWIGPTRGILFDDDGGTYSKPVSWTEYIDLSASGTDPVFNFSNFEILADGSAEFGGAVASDTFTATSATFRSGESADSQVKIGSAEVSFAPDDTLGNTASVGVESGLLEIKNIHWTTPAADTADILLEADGTDPTITLDADKIKLGNTYAGNIDGNVNATGNISADGTVYTNQGVRNRSSNRETLSSDKTLTASSEQFQSLDPGGATIDVNLPAETNGLFFMIVNSNSSSGGYLRVKDDSGALIRSLGQYQGSIHFSDGTGWMTIYSDANAT